MKNVVVKQDAIDFLICAYGNLMSSNEDEDFSFAEGMKFTLEQLDIHIEGITDDKQE